MMRGYIRAFRLPKGSSYISLDKGYFLDDDYAVSLSSVADDVSTGDTDDTSIGFGTVAFLELCKSGTATEVRAAIDAGADVNARDGGGWTPLMFAASAEVFAEIPTNEDMVRLLLDAGADIRARNEDGNTALYLVRKWGGERSPAHPLLRAAALAAGMSVDEDVNDDDTGFDIGSFFDLCAFGTAEEVRATIESEADVNIRRGDWTPLTIAAGYNDVDTVRVLLDADADVNAADDNGWTPLMSAVVFNKPAIALLLLDVGADVSAAAPNGRTPLTFAAIANDAEMVRLLLDAGADIRARDEDGKTALDYAKKDTPAYVLLRDAARAAGMSVEE